MIIDKNKPLPEHTKLDYDECYAKILLENVFLENIELCNSDKPDLICKELSLGIEVTSAIRKEDRELHKLWYMMHYLNEEQQERNKERMLQLGVSYTGGLQVWGSRTFYHDKIEGTLSEDVYLAFNSKVEKLNKGNYQKLNRYDLFIDSQTFLPDKCPELLLDKFIEYNNKPKKFEFVYLTTTVDFYKFDLINKKITVISYNDFHCRQRDLANQARLLVEEGEENDET